MHILFVCSGNTCRSPMAEALFRKQLMAKQRIQAGINLEARSAGLYAGTDLAASHEAVQVMAEMGIDLSRHRSQPLRQELLLWADVVLTMTDSHSQQILRQYEVPVEKLYTLAEYTGAERVDIVDPYGAGITAYRRSARQLRKMINDMLKKFC